MQHKRTTFNRTPPPAPTAEDIAHQNARNREKSALTLYGMLATDLKRFDPDLAIGPYREALRLLCGGVREGLYPGDAPEVWRVRFFISALPAPPTPDALMEYAVECRAAAEGFWGKRRGYARYVEPVVRQEATVKVVAVGQGLLELVEA